MLKVACVFPGQGSQRQGMGRDFYQNFPLAKDIFEEANSLLGFDLSSLCFQGPEDRLSLTSFCQPAVFVVSIIAWRLFEEERPKNILVSSLAGHSLGEYTALTASGSLSFSEALKLVYQRGKFMEEASRKYPGGMAAVLGLPRETVEEVCVQFRKNDVLEVANINCPGQVVISGSEEALKRAMETLKVKGARKVVPLKVSGAFHTSLMGEAGEKLKEAMDRVSFHSPSLPVVSNVNGQFVNSPQMVSENLYRQITHPVLWEDCVRRMGDEGVNFFLELGPGKVLKGLIRRILPEVEVLNVEDSQTLNSFLEFVRKNNL